MPVTLNAAERNYIFSRNIKRNKHAAEHSLQKWAQSWNNAYSYYTRDWDDVEQDGKIMAPFTSSGANCTKGAPEL